MPYKPTRLPWKKKRHSEGWKNRRFHRMLRRLECSVRELTLFEQIVQRFCPGVVLW